MLHRANAKHFHSLPSLVQSILAVCLIALLLTSASCLHTVARPQTTCSHCNHQMPASQNVPPCCSATHHPAATLVTIEAHQPAQMATIITVLPGPSVQGIATVIVNTNETPPRSPQPTLRI